MNLNVLVFLNAKIRFFLQSQKILQVFNKYFTTHSICLQKNVPQARSRCNANCTSAFLQFISSITTFADYRTNNKQKNVNRIGNDLASSFRVLVGCFGKMPRFGKRLSRYGIKLTVSYSAGNHVGRTNYFPTQKQRHSTENAYLCNLTTVPASVQCH